MRLRESSRTTDKYQGLLFPVEAVLVEDTRTHQMVRKGVLASFHRWIRERQNPLAESTKWHCIDWYRYEKQNFEASLDYDERCAYFNTQKFIGFNAAITKEGDEP